jgi:anaerobic selenocysteine-containing dehydrogenase
MTTQRGVCPHDCPDRCVWQVTLQDGAAVKLVGDPDQPFTRGVLCAKVDHYLERVYNPDRVLHPMRRVGAKGQGEFERVSWDDALDDVASRLKSIIAQDGPTAILPYSYMGTQGLVQSQSIDRRFFARLGATRLERGICGNAGSRGVAATMGTNLGMLPEDVVHSRFIILWGTNTLVTNLHLWPFILRARAAGATVVVIDPLQTRTAQAADWHVRPMPGTDSALALGMMHVIVGEGLHDTDYVARYTLGFDLLRERLQEYPPDRVAELTGLDAQEIVRLARAYATTRPSAIRVLVGMEHHASGAMTYRTVACLPALVGAWRERGGGLLHMTSLPHAQALNLDALALPELEDRTVRQVNMAQLGQALTDKNLAPPIRALVVHSSNPAVIAPNQNLVLRGLARDDLFTVVHEQFITDTARYADYVFPATTQLEQLDLLSSWGHTYVTLNRPAIAPLGEAVPNTEFFRRLSARMGFEDAYLYDSDEDLVRMALASDHPYLKGITFERLIEESWAPLNLPEDWRPFAQGGFPTPSGRCEFYAEGLIEQGLDPLPAYVPPRESPAGDPELAARYPLALITAKSALHFLNSSYANLPRHLKAEGEPLLEMHQQDAAARRIEEGQRVRVYNDRGTVELRVRVGDRVRPGVISMPSGWWASLSPGGSSANALTPDGLSDLGGGANFHDTLVEVERVG